jgi:hypothetical protein
MEKVDRHDAYKTEMTKLEFFVDTDNPALDTKYSHYLTIFKDGFSEKSINCFVCKCLHMKFNLYYNWRCIRITVSETSPAIQTSLGYSRSK